MNKLKISVLIPAFNEAVAIGPVVSEIFKTLKTLATETEIIVIDDGSTDNTAAEAKKAGAVVLRHPSNKGYGLSLETGIRAAKNDWIMMIDADGSYPPSEIPKLLNFAPEFDLVIGMRTGVHFWGSPLQTLRRAIYLRMAGFIVGESIPDANSGLRLVRKSGLLDSGPVHCQGYSYSTTMTLTFIKSGRFVKFVPVQFHARIGRSKVKPLRDILRMLQLMTEVLLIYNPLKLFASLSSALAGLSFLVFADWLISGRPGEFSAFWWLASLAWLCFLWGCLLDVIRILHFPKSKDSLTP